MTEDGIIGCCLLDDTDLMDMNLSKFWEIVKDRKPGVLQSMWLQIAGRVLALNNSNSTAHSESTIWTSSYYSHHPCITYDRLMYKYLSLTATFKTVLCLKSQIKLRKLSLCCK